MAHKLLLVLLGTMLFHMAYPQFILNVGNPCPYPGYQCINGYQHHMCHRYPLDSRCTNFKKLPMSKQNKQDLMNALNKLRDSIANKWRVTMMNNVYWTDELGRLADSYLRFCTWRNDMCRRIGKDKYYHSITLFKKVFTGNWVQQVIDQWAEHPQKDNFNAWRDYEINLKNNEKTFSNFTNLIWPNTQFFGCAMARMQNGVRIFCYFHPTHENYNYTIEDMDTQVVLGDPCTDCKPGRTKCSINFPNLCGPDLILATANRMNSLMGLVTICIAVGVLLI